MGKRNRQKKGDDKPKAPTDKPDGPVTTDPRFSKVHSDPRFLKPKFQANKVKVDNRFKAIFEDDMSFKYTGKGYVRLRRCLIADSQGRQVWSQAEGHHQGGHAQVLSAGR